MRNLKKNFQNINVIIFIFLNLKIRFKDKQQQAAAEQTTIESLSQYIKLYQDLY